jgi:hypothetical protein
MTQTDINKLRVEVATDVLKSFISKVITTQERIMFLKTRHQEASKKKEKDRTEEDKKLIRELEVNIATYTESVVEAESHIENFRILIEGYTEGRPVEV